jgi:hypothetical protein
VEATQEVAARATSGCGGAAYGEPGRITAAGGRGANDTKAVAIWETIRDLYRDHRLDLDFVPFSNYEVQVD